MKTVILVLFIHFILRRGQLTDSAKEQPTEEEGKSRRRYIEVKVDKTDMILTSNGSREQVQQNKLI